MVVQIEELREFVVGHDVHHRQMLLRSKILVSTFLHLAVHGSEEGLHHFDVVLNNHTELIDLFLVYGLLLPLIIAGFDHSICEVLHNWSEFSKEPLKILINLSLKIFVVKVLGWWTLLLFDQLPSFWVSLWTVAVVFCADVHNHLLSTSKMLGALDLKNWDGLRDVHEVLTELVISLSNWFEGCLNSVARCFSKTKVDLADLKNLEDSSGVSVEDITMNHNFSISLLIQLVGIATAPHS